MAKDRFNDAGIPNHPNNVGNNPIVNTNDLFNAFQSATTKNEIAEVLKELFDENKIYLIGDLTKDEIKLATRIYMVAEMKNLKVWKDGLAFYCKLMLSKNRKSRKEMIDAVRGYNPPQGFMQKINPFKTR